MPPHPSILQAPALAALTHGFCTRRGGVSTGTYDTLNLGRGSADRPEHIAQNRDLVRTALGADRLLTPYQVHSADCLLVTQDNVESIDRGDIKVDALVTHEHGLAIGILTADCAPILFADHQKGIVGAAHAGWRGALGGVIDATVDTMCQAGAQRDHIKAVIGPCISQPAYEVGDEFYASFCTQDAAAAQFFTRHRETQNWHFDLPRFCLARLAQCGVAAEWIGLCTYMDRTQFFSYRRNTHEEITDYGRQGSFIRC
jgi:YfiH family protein